MTDTPPERHLATGPINFDPNLKTTDLDALPVPTDVADPHAIVIRAGETKGPGHAEFIRWLERRNVDSRFVHRVEVRRDLLTVTVYRRKGHVEQSRTGVHVVAIVTNKDGEPVDDPPIVIRLSGVHELPPGVPAR